MRAKHIENYYANYQQALTKEVNYYSHVHSRSIETSLPGVYTSEYPVVESQLVLSLDVKLLPLDYQPGGETQNMFIEGAKRRWIQHQIALDNSQYVMFFAVDDVNINETDWMKKPCGIVHIYTPASFISDSDGSIQGGEIVHNMAQLSGCWKHDCFSIRDKGFSLPNTFLIFFAGDWYEHLIPYSSVNCNLTIYKLVLTDKYLSADPLK